MLSRIAALFSALISRFRGSYQSVAGTQPCIRRHSQTHVLRGNMEAAGMTHGEERIVNIRNIHAEVIEGRAVIYFCDSELETDSILKAGDGNPLPQKVLFEGSRLPGRIQHNHDGTFDLEGVKLSSNGTIRIGSEYAI